MRFDKKARMTAGLALGALAVTAGAAAQEMPPTGPPAEMEQVAFMVGTWKTDAFQSRMGLDDDMESSSATMTIAPILGGSAHRTHFESTLMGMDFVGQGTLTFNRQTGKWQSSWVDNMGAYQSFMEGTTIEGDTVVFEGEDLYQGANYKTRDTTKRVSDDELDWTMEMSMDGGKTWYTGLKATYKRQ